MMYRLMITGYFTLCMLLMLFSSLVTDQPAQEDNTIQITPTASFLDAAPVRRISEVLAERNQDCVLPCFLGFTPQEDTREDILKYLVQEDLYNFNWSRFEDDYDIYGYTSLEEAFLDGQTIIFAYLSDDMESRGSFDLRFFTNDDIIQRMNVHFLRPNVWLTSNNRWVDLPDIFAQMESIPQIFINRWSRVSEFGLVILYPLEGVELRYEFDFLQDNPDSRNRYMCLNIERTHEIYIEIGEADSVQDEIPMGTFLLNYFSGDPIDVATFVQFFIDNPNGCFDRLDNPE